MTQTVFRSSLIAKCLFWLLIANCATAEAQQNPNGQFNLANLSDPYLFLIRDPYVHQELGLSPGQRRKLQSLNDKGDMKIWSARNLPPDKAREATAKIIQITQEHVAKILDRPQLERLRQIEMWVHGIRSLARPDVVRRLELTRSQQRSLQELFQQFDSMQKSLHERLQKGEDSDKLNREFRDQQLELQRQAVDILSPAQQRLWVAMLGKRIELDQLGKVKFKSPDIQSKNWINSEPLSLEQLKGKVVALHFFAFA